MTEILSDDATVLVCRQPGDYRYAEYKVSGVDSLHWSKTSGGVRKSLFGQYFLYGYVYCDEAVSGEVAHSCMHGSAPHCIKVYIPKKGNGSVYEALIEDLPKKPGPRRAKPITGRTCKEDMHIIIAENNTLRRTEIIGTLLEIGHGENNIKRILRKQVLDKKLICEMDPKIKRLIVRINETVSE